MLVRRIANATRFLGAPRDWDPEKDGFCGMLPIADVEIDGMNYQCSAWEPTPEELQLLIAGKSIILMVLGRSHPVVAMTVSKE